MNSKIVIYIPGSWQEEANNKKCFKRIRELGFENVIIEASFILSEVDIVTLLKSENLSLWGVANNRLKNNEEAQNIVHIMHQLDCGNFLNFNGNEDQSQIFKIISESGIKILEKNENYFVRKNNETVLMPIIQINALSFVETPLQSRLVMEKNEEIDELNLNREKNIYYLIQPDIETPVALYLKHCKDILNRFFFLGIR